MCREVIKFRQHETAKQFYFLVNRFDLWKLRIGLEGLENFKGVLACVWLI